MISRQIVDSDAFLDMPVTARLLYYDLNMRADDDGFVNAPKKIMRMVGASTDDMNILLAKKFVIGFESGIVVIKHWRIHNYIRRDTYHETTYKKEKALLELDENKAYTDIRGRAVDGTTTQVRLDKVRLDKVSKTKGFTPPSLEEVDAYCRERNNGIDPQEFLDFYTSNGWMVGKNKMKDWKASVRTWERRRTPKREDPLPVYTGKEIEETDEELAEKVRRIRDGLNNDVH